MTYQGHCGKIKCKCCHSVDEEIEEANGVNILHGDPWDFPNESHEEVKRGTDGSVIVDGNQCIHFELVT